MRYWGLCLLVCFPGCAAKGLSDNHIFTSAKAENKVADRIIGNLREVKTSLKSDVSDVKDSAAAAGDAAIAAQEAAVAASKDSSAAKDQAAAAANESIAARESIIQVNDKWGMRLLIVFMICVVLTVGGVLAIFMIYHGGPVAAVVKRMNGGQR